ncbi:hypothetical protein [Phascolarctobacterium succinatutens]|jgi:hypothetical protein|uniref:hypothetical protein n=1 Tax=Phascolarctobacterium succinatutens TaxID=626940 RepID=UPI00206A9DA1|nr:MAG TPA: hypothetical protein [Caudoviricetes sp.]
MIDTTYNEMPKLTWGEIITVCGAAVLDAKGDGRITEDEAEKVFDVLSAAIHVMRDHKRAAEILKFMQEVGMDYESSINKTLAKRMEV